MSIRGSTDRRGTAASRGYGHRWQQARAAFLQQHPLCRMCSTPSRPVAASVVDHIEPHRLSEAKDSGDAVQIAAAQKRFWSRDNWQPLCKRCHDSTKQRMEWRERSVSGCDASGVPVDPRHHWHQPVRGRGV